ncbi:MFS transporter [Streptomyces sp. NPDC057690]|uniref:MFS transporter n=1 Tax=Streptomyces sp. NPDC057690 TaxID=3346214 RepID=UPI0036C05069
MSHSVSLPDPRRWTALVFISLAQLLVVLDVTITNIALPSLQTDLDIAVANRHWVITAYALAFGGLLLLCGRLADLLGRKPAFVIGLVGFAVASVVGGAAVDEVMMFAGRALQGLFAALLAPSAMSLLTVMFTDVRERAKAFGIFAAIAGAGGGVGLLLGGVLTEYLNWRWTFFVVVPFAVIGAVGGTATIREPAEARNSSRLDIPGTILVTAGLVALVYSFSHAETAGWGDAVTVSMFVTSALLLSVFVLVQAKKKAPLLPLRVVTERNRAGAFLVVALGGSAMLAVFLFLTYYLQDVKGYSPMLTGFAIFPMLVGLMVSSTQISARLLPFVRPRTLILPGLLTAAVGMVLLALLNTDSGYAAHVLPALILLGFGLGTAIMTSIQMGTHGVQPTDAGIASATVNASQQIGGAVGTALLNTVAASATATYAASHLTGGHEATLAAMTHGYTTAFWWATAFLALAYVTAAALINASRPGTASRVVAEGTEAEEAEAPLMIH